MEAMNDPHHPTRRNFLARCQVLASGPLLLGARSSSSLRAASEGKIWKVAIHMDTAVPTLGGHGLHAAFRGIPQVEVVSVFETNEAKAKQTMAWTGATRRYTNYEEMLEVEKPDIVVLTSRLPRLHLEQIRPAVARGCHVYCEKPLCAELEEADEILKLADENHVKIAVAHPCRHGLGFVTMKQMIAAGKIGTPLTAQAWGKSDHRGGGEDMMTLGCHVFDYMVYLFGAPEEVTGDVRVEGRRYSGPTLAKTVEDVGPAAGDEIFATFRFANGVRGIFESRKGIYNVSRNRFGVSVIGSEGMLSCRFGDSQKERQPLRFHQAPCAPAENSFSEEVKLVEHRTVPGAAPVVHYGPGLPGGQIFAEAGRYAAWDLIQAIEEDRAPVANLIDARTALEMIYGVYASHLSGGIPIALPLKDRRHPLRTFSPVG